MEQDNQATSSQAKRTGASPSVRFTALALLAALALSILAGYLGHRLWIEQARQEQIEAMSQTQAKTVAESVALRLQRYQDQLSELVQNPDSAAIVAAREPAALHALEQQVERLLPEGGDAQLVPAGALTSQPDIQEQLSFTELSMVTLAEKGEQVQPEARRHEGNWLIIFAVPVQAGTSTSASSPSIQGTLLARLPIDALSAALQPGAPGQVQLVQSFDERQESVLASLGDGSGEAHTAAVPGTYWQVQFTPSPQLRQQTHVSLLTPLLAWLAFTAIFVALAVYLARWLTAKSREQQQLAQSAAGNSGGKPAGKGGAYAPDDILDIELRDEDEALLGLEQRGRAADGATQNEASDTALQSDRLAEADIPEVIFRAYDIRGLADVEITPQLALCIGQALGSEALDNNQDTLVVARDARTHSPTLAEHLVRGILSTGCNVANLGAVPTPLMYFATETMPQTQSGVMVTASHNGAEYNGFKVVINGNSRSAEDIQNIRQRILSQDFYTGAGSEEQVDILSDYIDTIFSDVALAGDIHVVLDAANGITSVVAPRLFEELGCRVTPLFCELDGTFPNHAPDPSVAANLQQLVAKVLEEKADLGVAFDGDGDRLTVVSPSGNIIWADRLLLLFAKDIVARNPGADVVFDVKSTRQLSAAVSSFGGRPIMWKTGHAPMRAKMIETGALVGGEFSGHIFIKDRWYGFDDGIYAAARLIEIISLRGEDLDTMLAEFPQSHISPEFLVPVAEDKKFAIVRQLQEHGDFDGAKVSTLDGLRADFSYGWGLVRASNTSANLTLRFEADTEQQLTDLKNLFARELQKVDPAIVLS